MADDPYAQYLTPPAADDPYAKYLTPPGGGATAAPAQPQHGAIYNALFKEGQGGSALASADEGVLPAARDYALAGLDDLTLGLGVPSSLKDATARAQSNLGPMSYVTGAATYGLPGVGPGRYLGAAGKAIGAYSPIAKGLASTAAESALAGGVGGFSHGTGDPISDTLWGAAGGGVTGAAVHGLAGGVNAGVQKVLSKPGTVDPAAAIASTARDSADLYAQLHQKPADPQAITGAMKNVLTGLDPSVMTGMSPGLKNTILDIGKTVQNMPEANAGQLDSWQRQINAAAQRERYPTDKVVAGKLDSAFDGLIKQAGAGDLQDAAQAAYQRNVMAQNLSDWQDKVNAGAPLGQAPLTEAEWYKNQPDKQKSLVDLYRANQGGVDPSYTAAHLGSEIGGTAGYALGGFPGHLIGKSAGYYLGKTAGKKWKGNLKSSSQTAAIQSLYPGMTGIQPTGAVQGPQVGDMIKNLMIGTAF